MTDIGKPQITLLVATWDGFADCWDPFFKLLKTFWPHCPYPIALTTERKDYSFAGLDITPCRVNRHRPGRLSWSQVNLLALEHCVQSEVVLFMMDDFFINGPVDQATIDKCLALMDQNDYSCITLTNHDQSRTYHPTDNPLLSRIDDHSPYRITASPALWKKSALLRYLKPEENAWMFEKFGTRRSHRIKDSFYRVNESALSRGHDEAIPYFWTQEGDTGIVKGKWQAGIEALFEGMGVEMDYSIRGYYHRLPWILNKLYLAQKLLENPKATIAGLLGRP